MYMLLYNCSKEINKNPSYIAIGGAGFQSTVPPAPLVGVVYW